MGGTDSLPLVLLDFRFTSAVIYLYQIQGIENVYEFTSCHFGAFPVNPGIIFCAAVLLNGLSPSMPAVDEQGTRYRSSTSSSGAKTADDVDMCSFAAVPGVGVALENVSDHPATCTFETGFSSSLHQFVLPTIDITQEITTQWARLEASPGQRPSFLYGYGRDFGSKSGSESHTGGGYYASALEEGCLCEASAIQSGARAVK